MTIAVSSINPLNGKIQVHQTTARKAEGENSNWFSDWLNDKDKVCTDGKDDGSISFTEGLASFGKGLAGIIKGAINSPIATAATVGAGALLTYATGGAILPVFTTLGIGLGTIMIGKGVYDAATAKTDGEAKYALETIGNGTFALGASALTAKASLNAAAKAGVTSAQGAKDMNIAQASVQAFKSIPEAIKVSGANIKGNVLTWTTGTLHANSNAARANIQHTVQNSKIEAYKVDLNGTVDEVLAKNPGLSYDAQAGKYYVQTSWGEKSYINNKNYMVVKYATGDFNAVDEIGFKPYTDQITGESIDITRLDAGQSVKAAKVGKPTTYKIAKAGTKYLSAEGEHTLEPKSVLRFDDAGRPYQSTVEYMLENTKLTDAQISELEAIDPLAVAKHKGFNIVNIGLETNRQCNTQQYIAQIKIGDKVVDFMPEHDFYVSLLKNNRITSKNFAENVLSYIKTTGKSAEEVLQAGIERAKVFQYGVD